MLSINMRVFKTVLLIAFLGASVQCLPVTDKLTESKIENTSVVPQEIAATTAAPTSTYPDTTDYYDQRQNGSENYRIHVDGVVLVIAPVEALLLAGAAATTEPPNLSIPSLDGSSTQSVSDLDKPGVDSIHNKTDPVISKTIHKPALRLANFFAPFIRHFQHERGTSVH
ncbi:uncharacterized protein LOC105431725 [Pogonomyrmex barbatus]|uniref:Uncharacterized protein LOC105431725 n=1 Tax=Pogonomyrmex barbatus TaxID=144034 RepID=A0A6I9XGC3_9HYME|nr:uncharacterized protein LOC105431725 [Pogonomyrmex barbatus]